MSLFHALDHVIIAVADLEGAGAEYTRLLGRTPSWRGEHPTYGTRNTLFRLDNTYLELLAVNPEATGPWSDMVRQALDGRAERPFGMALGVSDVDGAVAVLRRHGLQVSDPLDGQGVESKSRVQRSWRNAFVAPEGVHGLRLLLIQHQSAPDRLPIAAFSADRESACTAVDHVVIFTTDLAAARSLWVDGLGVPEIWNRDFPERGTRNIGLDLGGITVELIVRTDRTRHDILHRLWGVAYRVAACERAVERARHAGIAIDDPRAGLAPDTHVATVRWERTPTLLLERV